MQIVCAYASKYSCYCPNNVRVYGLMERLIPSHHHETVLCDKYVMGIDGKVIIARFPQSMLIKCPRVTCDKDNNDAIVDIMSNFNACTGIQKYQLLRGGSD